MWPLSVSLVTKRKMKNEESTSILDQLDVHMVFATLVRFFPDAFMRNRTEGESTSTCSESLWRGITRCCLFGINKKFVVYSQDSFSH